MNKQLEQKLKDLPKSPGVYFHKNAAGEIIYVGKAAVLKNRVRQYFQKSRARDPKTDLLVSEIADTDWQVVDSEMEALFLEGEMIRRYIPRYNILLRDDKSMSYIRVDYDSDYPTVATTRRPLDDGARYFGPYFSATSARQALKVLRRIFPFATRQIGGQKRVTLHYHLGLDPGLEESKTTLKDYRANLRRLMAVIEGKRKTVEKEIEKEMKTAAKNQEFETAAKLRNQLFLLQNLSRQTIFSDKEFLDISKDHALSELVDLLKLEKFPRRIEGYDISHMSGRDVVASMVVFTNGTSDKAAYRKFKVSERNDDPANMHDALFRRLSDKNLENWGVPDLIIVDGGAQQLNAALNAQSERGTNIPMIGLAKQNEEVVIKIDGSHVAVPDVVNPNARFFATTKGSFMNIDLHPGQYKTSGHSLSLRGASSSQKYANLIKLLQRIRDESHRFAISYHSTLSRKRQTASVLEEIPGIGPATRKKLIKTFGSLKALETANESEVASVIGAKKAANLLRQLGQPKF